MRKRDALPRRIDAHAGVDEGEAAAQLLQPHRHLLSQERRQLLLERVDDLLARFVRQRVERVEGRRESRRRSHLDGHELGLQVALVSVRVELQVEHERRGNRHERGRLVRVREDLRLCRYVEGHILRDLGEKTFGRRAGLLQALIGVQFIDAKVPLDVVTERVPADLDAINNELDAQHHRERRRTDAERTQGVALHGEKRRHAHLKFEIPRHGHPP
jgi:hypothetical protein